MLYSCIIRGPLETIRSEGVGRGARLFAELQGSEEALQFQWYSPRLPRILHLNSRGLRGIAYHTRDRSGVLSFVVIHYRESKNLEENTQREGTLEKKMNHPYGPLCGVGWMGTLTFSQVQAPQDHGTSLTAFPVAAPSWLRYPPPSSQ